jgi:hypothetical protein
MTMYSKNLPIPPKFDYPYQQQQRYSGSFIVSKAPPIPKELGAETLRELEETVGKISAGKK